LQVKGKRISDLVVGLAVVALAGIAFLLWSQSQSVAKAVEQQENDPESRVVAVMQKMEVHVERLYYSGRDQDWEQAKQALEAVSGAANHLYHRNLLYGEINISAAAESVLPDEFKRLGDVIQRRDREAFLREYRQMIQICNSCHRATGQIAVVQEPPSRERRDLH